MEEEEVGLEQTLILFDLYWFRHHVLLSPPPPPQTTTTPAVAAVLDPEEDARSSNVSEPVPASSPRRPIARHRRTLSDERDPFGSDTGLERSRLETILSGKESAAAEIGGGAAAERGRCRRRRWRRRRRASSATTTTTTRSLSDLEFEELKGLMDLGFTFSEAEAAADPRLVEIVPALRRRSMAAAESTSPPTAEGGDDAAGVARPYLSEAWDEAEEKEEEAAEEEEEEEEEEKKGYVLRNWRIPVFADEVDLKENLRLWAHTVASTVL